MQEHELLKLENVSLTYQTKTDEIKAIANLTFSLDKGEFVSIIGPSGCGKTTVLSMIAGLLKPSYGKITPWPKTATKSVICCKKTSFSPGGLSKRIFFYRSK